eukprot:TRINITY_DN10818_c0_g1_i2.p1 TRINITY_DN10818_c0_g1~~TRINITY_DN10818_c0_g1_i2.p1  ORF type:complete len:110 (+),score=35.64 TRINITY_DN10818_c0_g1_i2:132-461(+)
MQGRELLPPEAKKVNLSLFSYLFAELISYLNAKDDSRSFEQRLSEIGFPIGQRILEHCAMKRLTRFEDHVKVLQFISTKLWPLLFNLSLIHICRCRRYAVCRSRWSPYH